METSLVLEKLSEFKKFGLVDSAFLNIKRWLEGADYVEFSGEIEKLVEKADIFTLNDAFYQVIPFGTGGRRGKMGAGTNRINSRTIAESAQGFSDYLLELFGKDEVEKKGVVITYDVRRNSRLFAQVAAEVFAGNNIHVYFFEGVRSTPLLSFAIRYKKALGGAMISASHNPPSDNGIKVYGQTGGQVVPPHDGLIIDKVSRVREIKKIEFVEAIKLGKVEVLDNYVDKAYYREVSDLSLGDYRDVGIVFTPMHGCATTSLLPVLKNAGFENIHDVKEQMVFDSEFSTIKNKIPNPEVPISLELAIAYAKKQKADLVLAADPDADRLGVVSRENLNSDNYVFLNGNQIGVLLLSYIVGQLNAKNELPKNGLVIKTAVTTDLLEKIAKKNGLNVIGDLPVGFKYIADAMENRTKGKRFIFGAEESHGYLYGDYARDKDSAVGALLICEYAAMLKKEGKTLFEQLEYIKKEYGYYRELLLSLYFNGMDGMEKMRKIMDVLRHDLPKKINDYQVCSVLDQLTKKYIALNNNNVQEEYAGFPDNALIFYLNEEKTMRVVVRPSGTEPKIKFYVAVGKEVGLDKSPEEYQKIKKETDDLAYKVLEDFAGLAEVISPGGERFEVLG